jgi:hypothetical protein
MSQCLESLVVQKSQSLGIEEVLEPAGPRPNAPVSGEQFTAGVAAIFGHFSGLPQTQPGMSWMSLYARSGFRILAPEIHQII